MDNTIYTMYFSAIRYALGRASYISSEAIDWTKSVLPHLSDWRRSHIKEEILEYLEGSHKMLDCNINNWKKVVELLEN